MFGETYKVKLTLDANGVPTAMASATNESMLAGAIADVTSVLTEDETVIGMGRTVGRAATIMGSAWFTNYKLTGKFNLNPLKVG